MARIKRSRLAGTWYAAGAQPLREQVDALFRAAGAPPHVVGPLASLVVPHAGYVYSGRAAAAGYAWLRGQSYERAVILAPSHFAAFHGMAVLNVDAFETPLGLVSVDTAAFAGWRGHPLVQENPAPFHDEHAIEMQLPLLQCVLPGIAVVPVLVGDVGGEEFATLAAVLRPLAGPGTIFLVSSDFVHYGEHFGYLPFPPDGAEPVRTALRQLDMGAIECVCAADAPRFRAYVERTGATICGRAPIAVFLELHARRTRGELITYYTSLDVTGDYEHCVSYASIAFPR
jgi:hypothetical protein